ncbi:uncharacterized protein LOC133329562 [Musca vetustissima]|uniref:uncharacterized protein LOC133322457 n=1 Tax=Musca vetustissima TaxID=27455 RepID=UPI002AB621A1|nr:uncharacterized protein LOC133322457 [Musca vetustissima]XP_061394023.1 uncharacterized protein LOC133329562 [Musca vetustissima]
MAILLVHLRRLILLISIVYLSGAFVRKLLTDSRQAYLVHMNSGKSLLWAKHLHFQWWAYIYTCYAYIVLVNYVNMRRYTTLLEYFFT